MLLNNHEIIPTDSIVEAMKANNIIFDNNTLNLKPLEKRISLLNAVHSNWEKGIIGDIAMLKFFQECFLKSKEHTKIEGVFLSKAQDFSPIIIRGRVISLAIKRDRLESLNLINKINVRKGIGLEILNSVDYENPDYFENFLLLLSFWKKSTGSYTGILQSYLQKEYEDAPAMIQDILTQIELEFKSEDRVTFFSLLDDLIKSGVSITNWCEQLKQLLIDTMDIDPEEDNADNIHLFDKIDVWSFSTIQLICGVARQRVKHYFELFLDVTLMIQFINNNASILDSQKMDIWTIRPFEDYIQSLFSFLVLMNYSPELNNLNKAEHKEIKEVSDVIYTLNHIDMFTYFVIFQYRRYLGNSSSYHLFEVIFFIDLVYH